MKIVYLKHAKLCHVKIYLRLTLSYLKIRRERHQPYQLKSSKGPKLRDGLITYIVLLMSRFYQIWAKKKMMILLDKVSVNKQKQIGFDSAT